MPIQYERHLREYSIVGATTVFTAFWEKRWMEMYGATLREIIIVIRDDSLYHFQRVGDREQMSRALLRRIAKGAIDFQKIYRIFDCAVASYETLLRTRVRDFTLDDWKTFSEFYHSLLRVAYMGADPINFSDELPPRALRSFAKWAERIRIRGELIYKVGERDFISRFCEWLARTHFPSYTARDLAAMTMTEMDNAVSGSAYPPARTELDARRTLSYIRMSRGGVLVKTGKEARKAIATKCLFTESHDDLEGVTEVRGQTAFAGVVRGRVCLVRMTTDMKKFAPRDIIVSPMTDPRFLPIMKRAAAFVTNEGGMLCHAAIVARELKKPCVIGTKIATHVFHDGETIEVDATQGIVRKV